MNAHQRRVELRRARRRFNDDQLWFDDAELLEMERAPHPDTDHRRWLLELRKTTECHVCGGYGLAPSAPDYSCTRCGGSGRLPVLAKMTRAQRKRFLRDRPYNYGAWSCAMARAQVGGAKRPVSAARYRILAADEE